MGSSYSKAKDNDTIEDYITEILNDKNANITIIPDSMEAKIYKKLIIILVLHIKKSLENIKISLFNYNLTFKFEKIEQK